MKLEAELARAEQVFYSMPVRTAPDAPPVTADEVIARKRTVRLQTQALIDQGLLSGDPVALAHCLADTMLVAGGTFAQFGLDPTRVENLLLAAKELVENARKDLETNLSTRDWEAVAQAATQLQVICGGLCYVLGLPYRELLAVVHERYLAGGVATREDIEGVLRAKGFPLPDPAAANDQ